MVDASVIVPTLNEAENIDALLARVERCVEAGDFGAQILVVDDGTTDGTVERVRRWEAHPVYAIWLAVGRPQGGMNMCRAEAILPRRCGR